MESKYFDNWEFQQALGMRKTNPIEARLRYEEYLKKYPEDYSCYTYYAAVLIRLGEFDLAEKVLDYVKTIASRDSHFANQFQKVKNLEGNILFNKLKILYFTGRYEELYNLYLLNEEKLKSIDVDFVFDMCKKKIGKLNCEKRDSNSYLYRQIIEYKESEFLDHIKKHLADYNQHFYKPNKNIFCPDFPIEKIIEETKKYIPSEKRIFNGFFDNIYVFKYDECGREDNRLVNYFQVICFHDTKDFITMFPSSECEKLPYVDLNYLIEKPELPKTKKYPSKIEKFFKKYGRK